MSKVTNKKENYRSRSKNICKSGQAIKSEPNIQVSRSNFTVDSNGYFLWRSRPESKKI